MTARAGGPPPHRIAEAARPVRATVDIAAAGDTPILREYRAVKAAHPGCIVLARLGDFYEMFGADAETAAPVLGLALTGRSFGNAGRVPMCGVPHHSAAQHIRRLLEAGHRVAVWDQVGEVGSGHLVERRVTRVITPGTAIDAELLDGTTTSRCVALLERDGRVGIAALDASTGHLELLERSAVAADPILRDDLLRFDAAELLLPEGAAVPDQVLTGVGRTRLAPSLFDAVRGDERLAVASGAILESLDADDVPLARAAGGALLAYAERCGVRLPSQLLRIDVLRPGGVMRLDRQTRRNLELFQPLSGRGAALLSVLDRTRTAMGARLLRDWLQAPLTEVDLIAARCDAITELAGESAVRRAAGDALRQLRDIERLATRCAQGTVRAHELAALRDACHALPALRHALQNCRSAMLAAETSRLEAPPVVPVRLDALLVESPPDDGGAIRHGADEELDALLDAAADARSYIATLEQRERERSGIRSLRVGYNRVFGYYLEVPNAHREAVPADYVRKQTLAGAERYITADLREQEAIVLHARDRALVRERELLDDACRMVTAHAAALTSAGRSAAVIDVLVSLAEVAMHEHWTQPDVDTSEVIHIEAGRHPLVERALGPGRFVPNDCTLDAATRILVLTGPNMAGKSTYLRQVAVITLLAHIGSWVPARSARIGVCDRIFTRVGAQDDLSGGMSTFMVEMAETATILRQATPRSLVILDEIGRGTSTYDGLSIAQAVLEHLHDAPQLNCRTLFATHYHELTGLESQLPRARNARVEVEEDGDSVTFLHRIVPGGADRSYGIHVAKLAGVPATVLLRARSLLESMEAVRPGSSDAAGDAQLALPIAAPAAHPVVADLAALDIDAMTPLNALNALADLRRRASG